MLEPDPGLWIETLEEIATKATRLPPGDIYKTPISTIFQLGAGGYDHFQCWVRITA